MNNKYRYHVFNVSPHILMCHHLYPDRVSKYFHNMNMINIQKIHYKMYGLIKLQMKVHLRCNGIVDDKSFVNEFRCINVGNVV